MIVNSNFVPAKGLSSRHLQTVLPMMLKPDLHLNTTRERLELPDGDFMEFDWLVQEEQPTTIAIFLPGLSGNLTSPYIQCMARQCIKRGWTGLIMYYRGRSGFDNASHLSYHLGDTVVLETLVRSLTQRYSKATFFAVGFSMGGNILLKWLGESHLASAITCAAAVSTPFDLRKVSHHIRYGSGRFYQWYLLNDLRDYIKTKYEGKEAPFAVDKVSHLESFWEFDERFTAPINGFQNAADYYNRCSSRWHLQSIKVPTLCIHALDDPFIIPEALPSEDELSEHIEFELSEFGGHVGFISGSWRQPTFWLEQRIPEFVRQYITKPVTRDFTGDGLAQGG